MWQRFTERARKVVFFSQEEAARFGDKYVSTEHILLGLLREPETVAGRILSRLGLDHGAIRAAVEGQMTRTGLPPAGDMQLTPRAKRVIDLGYDEAKQLHNNYIGTEHLLLGLIREDEGMAGRILEQFGVNLEAARQAVRDLQEGGAAALPADPQPDAATVIVSPGPSTTRIVANAVFEARELGSDQPNSEHFLLALFTADDGRSVKIFEQLGWTRDQVLKAMEDLP